MSALDSRPRVWSTFCYQQLVEVCMMTNAFHYTINDTDAISEPYSLPHPDVRRDPAVVTGSDNRPRSLGVRLEMGKHLV